MAARPPLEQDPAHEVVRAAAAAMSDDLDRLSTEIATAMTGENSFLDGFSTPTKARRAFGDVIGGFLVWVIDGGPDAPAPGPSAIDVARATARSGTSLRVLLRGLRSGHRRFLMLWDEFLAEQSPSPELLTQATSLSRDMTFAWIDALSERLTDEYERERDLLVRTGETQRAHAIAALLEGGPVDTDQLSRTLRYELSRWHTALVLWTPESGDDPWPRLEAASNEIARALGASGALTLTASATSLHAWVGTITAPDIRAITPSGLEGVSVAVGDPAVGAAGFRQSHRDALDARQVAASRARRPGAITRYRSVELAAMLVHDPERTRRFVRAQLGELALDDDHCGRLRATLRVYLDEHCSRLATAERLGVHPNTIGNRIRACQELLDRDLGNGSLELHAALALADQLGSPVLVPADPPEPPARRATDARPAGRGAASARPRLTASR